MQEVRVHSKRRVVDVLEPLGRYVCAIIAVGKDFVNQLQLRLGCLDQGNIPYPEAFSVPGTRCGPVPPTIGATGLCAYSAFSAWWRAVNAADVVG